MHSLKRYVVLLGLLMLATSVFGAEGKAFHDEQGEYHFVPKDGFVPNEETAIKIAEAVWLPIYGETINDERPFHAKLIGDVWYVEGTLPEDALDGTAIAEISKTDGRILRVVHEQ